MPLKRSITAVTCGRFPKCSPAHLPSSLRRHNTVSRLRQHHARLPRVRCCFFILLLGKYTSYLCYLFYIILYKCQHYFVFSVDICTDCIFSASNIQHFVHNSQSYCRLFFLSLRIFDMYRQFGFLPMTSQTSKLCRQSMRMNLPNGSPVFPFYSCFPSNRCKFSTSFAALHKVLSKEVEACRTGKYWLEFQKKLCYNTPASENSLQHDEK